MTDHLDAKLAALERQLERESLRTTPPGLRRRVLSAVDDVLRETVPGTDSGWSAESPSLRSPDVVPGTVLATALAAIAAVMAFWATSMPHSGAPLTLDERARIAGVSDEPLGAFVADGRAPEPTVRLSSAADGSERCDTLRALDGHRLLQERL